MSNPLEGGSWCKSTGKHTEIFQSLNLHIAPWIQCAKLDGIAQSFGMITGHTSPVFINDAGNAALESPQHPRQIGGVVQK